MSVQQQEKKSGMGCWKIGLMGCGVVAILVVLVMVIGGYMFTRNPIFQCS
jgi:hypothetical protein